MRLIVHIAIVCLSCCIFGIIVGVRGRHQNLLNDEKVSCSPFDDFAYYGAYEIISPGEDEYNFGYSDGAVVNFTCRSGWVIGSGRKVETKESHALYTCENGKWKPRFPFCSPKSCLTPIVPNAMLFKNQKSLLFHETVKHGSSVELKCNKGFAQQGNQTWTCLYGEWDTLELPECLPVPCKLPPLDNKTVGNYSIKYFRNQVQEIHYVCENNFTETHRSSRCDSGKWFPQSPTCDLLQLQKKACNQPVPVKGAFMYQGSYSLIKPSNSSVTYSDGTEIILRCLKTQSKTKNIWKLRCNDGIWVGGDNASCNINNEGSTNLSLLDGPDESLFNKSCMLTIGDENLVTFMDGIPLQMLANVSEKLPVGTVLASRCIHIGKFLLDGPMKRKCMSGQWIGRAPKCIPLFNVDDFQLNKPPAILFEHENGNISQSIEGNLVISTGTTLHLDCIWLRKFGNPRWEISNLKKEYAENWAGANQESYLKYRLTIKNVTVEDAGVFSCATLARKSHKIKVEVK